MKNLIIAICACLLLCECKHEDNEPDCICTNLDVDRQYDTIQEGMIIFPHVHVALASYEIISKKDFLSSGQLRYALCTDSALQKQIETKQIKDSSQVTITQIGLLSNGICNILFQRTIVDEQRGFLIPRIRVKTIDKK
jgi:hypothetical protein